MKNAEKIAAAEGRALWEKFAAAEEGTRKKTRDGEPINEAELRAEIAFLRAELVAIEYWSRSKTTTRQQIRDRLQAALKNAEHRFAANAKP